MLEIDRKRLVDILEAKSNTDYTIIYVFCLEKDIYGSNFHDRFIASSPNLVKKIAKLPLKGFFSRFGYFSYLIFITSNSTSVSETLRFVLQDQDEIWKFSCKNGIANSIPHTIFHEFEWKSNKILQQNDFVDREIVVE